MAQRIEDEYKKDQDVEIYDSSKDRWIGGKIYGITTGNGGRPKVYRVEYEEYAKTIKVEDAHSVMRIPKTKQPTNDRDTTDAFINFRREIATLSPVSHETQIALNNTRNAADQRMSYMYMKTSIHYGHPPLF